MNIDEIRKYLSDNSSLASIIDNNKRINGRVVNLTTLPNNIKQSIQKLLDEFNKDNLKYMFIGDDGRFTFINEDDILPDVDTHDGTVDFSFVKDQPAKVDPRKIY